MKKIPLQTPRHFGPKINCDHDHSTIKHDESFIAEFLQSIDISTISNPVVLGMIFCIWYYTSNTKNSSLKKDSDFKILTSSGAIGIALPTLYHTVGHKIGLPHFPGEAALGEIGVTLGALGSYYSKSLKNRACFYAESIKKILKK